MQVLLALTAGLVIWIVAWAFGVNAVVAFLATIALVLGAATYRIAEPFLKSLLNRS